MKYFFETQSKDNVESLKYGRIMEPEARKKFLEVTSYKSLQVGLVVKNKYEFIGVSPDGLITGFKI